MAYLTAAGLNFGRYAVCPLVISMVYTYPEISFSPALQCPGTDIYPGVPPSRPYPRPMQPSNGLFQSPQPQPPGPPTPGRSLAARGPPQCRLGSRRPAQPCRVRCRGAGGGGEVTPRNRRTRWPDSLPGTEPRKKNRMRLGGPP